MQIGAATMENSMEVSQKLENRATIWYSNPIAGHISGQKYNSKRYMYTVFTETPFAIVKTWKRLKQPKRPSTDKWNGVCVCVYTHTVEYIY